MPECTINGKPVLSASISLPLHGAWTAIVEADTAEDIVGACTIETFGVQFQGFVRNGGVFQDGFRGMIVGGSGGLTNSVGAKFYRDVPARVPFADLMVAANAQPVAADASQAVLGSFLLKWTRTSGTVADALNTLLGVTGGSWRVLRDGALWVGEETWETSTIRGTLQTKDTTAKVITVSTDTPTIIPGITWQGYRTSYVVHKVLQSSAVTEVWYE